MLTKTGHHRVVAVAAGDYRLDIGRYLAQLLDGVLSSHAARYVYVQHDHIERLSRYFQISPAAFFPELKNNAWIADAAAEPAGKGILKKRRRLMERLAR